MLCSSLTRSAFVMIEQLVKDSSRKTTKKKTIVRRLFRFRITKKCISCMPIYFDICIKSFKPLFLKCYCVNFAGVAIYEENTDPIVTEAILNDNSFFPNF